MLELTFRLLGTPIVHRNGQVVDIRRRKEAALLYYLAATDRLISRDDLFALITQEEDGSTTTRNYFNVMLHRLVRILPGCIVIERDTVDFAPDCRVWVDVIQFQTTVLNFRSGDDPAPLQKAVDLYRGEFLKGFSARGAAAFEDWLLLEREQLYRLFIQALVLLLTEYERRQDTARGITIGQRLLVLEPWHETTHRQLMLLLARDGQHQAALNQYDICRQVLAEELGVDPMPETVALYEQLQTIVVPPPHNLPLAPVPFIGRETELVQIQETLSNPHCRLLTLLGLGGVGKTYLALEAARQLVTPTLQQIMQPFPDGIYYVSLVGVEGTTLANPEAITETINRVAIAIGQILGLSFTGRLAPPAQLRATLHDRHLLLLLDNYEHLSDTSDLLLDLLHHAPGLTLLVTSRERLNLDEEWLLTIGGLPLPTTPDEVPTAAASHLFVQEARRTQLTWAYSAADALPIARLCRLVDGLPLAIKLAAATLRYISCAALLEELKDTLAGLQTTLRNVPERHRSMHAVMAYSWELLSQDEQALLRRIAVFQGGFDHAAVRAVTQLEPEHLVSLVDKSLVGLDETGRYLLHELVRQFATAQLTVTADEVTQATRRHLHYYAHFITQQPHRLAHELDNIRAAWRWATAHQEWETVVAMQPHLAAFYERAGLLQEGEAAFAQAVAHLPESDSTRQVLFSLGYAHFLGLRGQYREALQLLTTLESTLVAITDGGLIAGYHEQRGWVLANQSAYPEAIASLEIARTLYHQAKRLHEEARSTYYIGVIARRQGNYHQSVNLLEIAQQLLTMEQIDNTDQNGLLSDVYTELSVTHSHQGRPQEAQEAGVEALWVSQRQDDRLREAIALNNLGALAQRQRNPIQARIYFQQALTLRWQMGDRAGEASSRFNLAGIDHDLGNYSAARDGMQAALAIFEEIGDSWEAVNVWNALGILYQELGDWKQAETCLQRGLDLARSIQDEAGQLFLLANLGLVLTDQGSLTQAVNTLQQGLHLAEQQGDADLIATFQSYLGLVYVQTDQPEQAAIYATHALELREQLEQQPLQIDDWATLAHVALTQDDLAQAETLATQITTALATCDYVGPEFPQRACFICYQIFQAVGDVPQAKAALDAAVRLVKQRAMQITDLDLRQSFCEQVPVNRAILTIAGVLTSPAVLIADTAQQRNGTQADAHPDTDSR